MSKSRSFSIYLLKEGYDATNGLKEDHSLDEAVAAVDGSLPSGSCSNRTLAHLRCRWWEPSTASTADIPKPTLDFRLWLGSEVQAMPSVRLLYPQQPTFERRSPLSP